MLRCAKVYINMNCKVCGKILCDHFEYRNGLCYQHFYIGSKPVIWNFVTADTPTDQKLLLASYDGMGNLLWAASGFFLGDAFAVSNCVVDVEVNVYMKPQAHATHWVLFSDIAPVLPR